MESLKTFVGKLFSGGTPNKNGDVFLGDELNLDLDEKVSYKKYYKEYSLNYKEYPFNYPLACSGMVPGSGTLSSPYDLYVIKDYNSSNSIVTETPKPKPQEKKITIDFEPKRKLVRD